jgi:lysyl-tRNA synthetase class 2
MRTLHLQACLLKAIRNFFDERGFLEVMPPPMVPNPGMETHIHPFEIRSTRTGLASGNYLHTSPEFYMKELLSLGMEKIYSVEYCFRDEPLSPQHRNQFLMLEWYRAGERYEKIMQDSEELVMFCWKRLAAEFGEAAMNPAPVRRERKTVSDLFIETLGFDILDYPDKESLADLIRKKFPNVPLPASDTNMEWDDYYFLLFLNEIEPLFIKNPFLLLYEFPSHLSALSTLKETDKRVCERFEIYMNGIEICNCFNELTDLVAQKKRFEDQRQLKKKFYGYELPPPEILFGALSRGLPESAGVAMGVERLLKVLAKVDCPFFI